MKADQSSQQLLQLDCEPAQELHDRFPERLGLSIRATNVLAHMHLESVAQFTALDEHTLLQQRNCGKKTVAEIMAAVTCYNSSGPMASNATEVETLSAAYVNAPVTCLCLSVRANKVLQYLNIVTLGELSAVSDCALLRAKNFGKTSLREVRSKLALFISSAVVWPHAETSASELNQHITRAAQQLQQLGLASELPREDRRYGHLIRAMGLGAANLREAADMIVSRKRDPANPEPLLRLLLKAQRVLRTASRMTLEDELFSLTDGCGKNRDRRIIASYMGWDGRPPKTLEEVGQEHKMTRERVRQICERVSTHGTARPFLPVLDRVLRMITAAVPTPVKMIENQLLQQRMTKGKFDIEAVRSAASVFGREAGFAVERLHGRRIVVKADSAELLNRIDHAARAAVSHWGVTTVDDVAAATSVDSALARKVVMALPGFKWLDESSGWFWISDSPRNALLTQIRKILAASPTVSVNELRTGVGRHHRRKGFAPPRRVLLELCRQLPWCHVQDDRVVSTQLLNPREELSDTEYIMFQILKEHGPIIPRPRLEELCMKAGVNQHSFWTYLSYCPIITRYAPGVHGLRGAEVPTGLVERLIPRRADKTRVLVDYGWTSDCTIQIVYRISAGMLSSGMASVPGALKIFLQGKFMLITGDNAAVGTLVVKYGSASGLGPFFSRRGGESGDYISLLFDTAKRVVVVQIGDASLVDDFETAQHSSKIGSTSTG